MVNCTRGSSWFTNFTFICTFVFVFVVLFVLVFVFVVVVVVVYINKKTPTNERTDPNSIILVVLVVKGCLDDSMTGISILMFISNRTSTDSFPAASEKTNLVAGSKYRTVPAVQIR